MTICPFFRLPGFDLIVQHAAKKKKNASEISPGRAIFEGDIFGGSGTQLGAYRIMLDTGDHQISDRSLNNCPTMENILY
jgi:hypothetical protein